MTDNEIDEKTATLIMLHQNVLKAVLLLGQCQPLTEPLIQAHALLLEAMRTSESVLGWQAWPPPTTPEPDEATIEDWLTYDDCQATDGCFVEESEVCQHGYPSWPRYLKMKGQCYDSA